MKFLFSYLKVPIGQKVYKTLGRLITGYLVIVEFLLFSVNKFIQVYKNTDTSTNYIIKLNSDKN